MRRLITTTILTLTLLAPTLASAMNVVIVSDVETIPDITRVDETERAERDQARAELDTERAQVDREEKKTRKLRGFWRR